MYKRQIVDDEDALALRHEVLGQRRARIAKGAGVTPTEVNSLMKQWGEMNKMMGRMRTMANQAQAGGKNPDGLQAAIDKAVELIGAQVK